MHRLVAYAHNGVQRFSIDRDEMVIGSDASCDIYLPYAGVGRQHARLRSRADQLEIEDMGSRRGVVVNGERVRETELRVLDEIRLGSIALLVEDVAQEPMAPGTQPADDEGPRDPVITAPRMLEHLARISQWVLADTASTTALESLVVDLLNDFGGGVLFLFQGEPEKRGIKFVIASEARWLSHGEELLRETQQNGEPGKANARLGKLGDEDAWIAWRTLRALDRPYLFVVALPRFRVQDWSPLPAFHTLADQLILGLVHHVGQFEPILFSQPRQVELTLAPGLVAGESKAMRQVLDQMRAAVDPAVHVLLRGEAGVSKELLARSLHLSSTRRDGPFITASCSGIKAKQLEAELFGAEIPGKSGPMVREGKLLLAHRGTLYLEDVDEMPLEIQDRMVRFLRSREVEPAGGIGGHPVDVRLIVASRTALETSVARDLFRIDLAYRLAQFTIDVPALRDRREDLPLLIQAAVNRCCHETGKRIQGITVKALDALVVYDYPGNLPELENIVRRLVYLCASGQPIDAGMLPEEVRLSEIKGLRPDIGSELHLERLVADCERAAIREALRRSSGNKSEAARQLGLSRNGLAMKMQRLELS